MNAFSAQNGSPAAARAAAEVAVNGAPQNSSRPPSEGVRRADAPDAKSKKSDRRMHRISTVRQRQGVSLRSVARQMRIDVRRLRAQEDESADLMLSTLYQWQKVLDVPISELLVETSDPLSPVILQRARMVKIMKTVAAILERSENKSIRRLAEMLTEQLTELMPELKDVSPWHSVGQRRTAQELGRIVERRLPDDFFIE
jgi:transcriptional regulator with XRE-family HTH domain